MYLYNLTLQKPTAINAAVYGNFSAPKVQEIVVARGHVLELLRVDEQGRLQTIYSVDMFCVIRALSAFRLTGANRDYLILGTDSGRIVILEFNANKGLFEKVHQETYGRSGCRRLIPGQYLATDPRGRAVMIAAVEKQKLVYILNRDTTSHLTISSPLEAHKSQTICYHVVGCDVGFDNPIFACIEMEYGDADDDPTGEAARTAEKALTFYELDLGLNHVVRKWGDTIDRTANMLVAVPGGNDGPGGVLVCAENYIYYRNQNHPVIRAALPRRQDSTTDRGLLIVSAATHKLRDVFFVLLQSELGDVYKVTLSYNGDGFDTGVRVINISYFDSIPVSNALCVLRTGFLFCASEFSNHYLYQFLDVGEDVPASSDEPTFFMPRALTNLSVIDELESYSPLTDLRVAELAGEDAPQLYALCGRGPRSSLRVLRHGLTVSEMASSELPGNPSAVWTVRTHASEAYDRYIVVSFVNATLVLSIGEQVEEVTDSGFLGTTPTLSVSLLGDDALLQVYPGGLRHIRADRRVNEWKTPQRKAITRCAVNQRQVAIALAGGDLVYFELDVSGQLMEMETRDLGQEVACLDLPHVPAGRQRAQFLAVGLYDQTVRLFSLDPSSVLQPVGMQACSAQPSSVALIDIVSGADATPVSYLSIGLQNGVMMRTVMDSVTGALSDMRQRFLGTRPVKLFKTRVRGSNALLALSSRSFLTYTYQNTVMTSPLTFDPLEYAATFSSEQCPEGICAISGNLLRIISCERLGEMFNQRVYPLTYTPRKALVYPGTTFFVVIETDHNVSTRSSRDLTRAESKMDVDSAPQQQQQQHPADSVVGAPQAGMGRWASCVRLLDAVSGRTLSLIDLDENEAAFSLALVAFPEKSTETYVAVGTAFNMTLHPRRATAGAIRLYRMTGSGLDLVHSTPTDDVPYALAAFQGRLLAGCGKALRIFDLGKKKLLRKCENHNFPNFIQSLTVRGDRIVVGDVQDAFMFVKYKRSDNQLFVFADTTQPRWLTATAMLDYDTMAGADKFGDVFVYRLPDDAQEAEDEDPTGNTFKWERGLLNGAPHKLTELAHVHTGDLVLSLQRTALVPGGSEVLLYSTVLGAVGALLPLTKREDVDFFSHLEMFMRQENPPLSGREHLAFRSAYAPVKNVLDGDLCEQILSMEYGKQRAISNELEERTPAEVAKKLEDTRTRVL